MKQVPPPRVDVPIPPKVTDSTHTASSIHMKQLKRPHTRITQANKPIVPQPNIIHNESTVEDVPTTNKIVNFQMISIIFHKIQLAPPKDHHDII